MREPTEVFAALAGSAFRRRFRLGVKEAEYLRQKGLEAVLQHADQFVRQRLAPAPPRHDGRQTPLGGHPVFIAQHATATCCRRCLSKWHRIPPGQPLSEPQIAYVVQLIRGWLARQPAEVPAPEARSRQQGRLF
jgi:hypothetical protein